MGEAAQRQRGADQAEPRGARLQRQGPGLDPGQDLVVDEVLEAGYDRARDQPGHGGQDQHLAGTPAEQAQLAVTPQAEPPTLGWRGLLLAGHESAGFIASVCTQT